MKEQRKRVDQLVVERGLCLSRERAQALILGGNVVVNDQRVDKPGKLIPASADIRVKGRALLRFVSRGGLKLEAALEKLAIDPTDRVALDVGASTGGFTDCLLQRGARRVFAVDVGYGQLHNRLRNDGRVVNIERVNARYLTRAHLGDRAGVDQIDLAVIDASFISLRLLLKPVLNLLRQRCELVALVKPQFEVGRDKLPKGAVVKDDDERRRVTDEIASLAIELGLEERGRLDSPTHGPRGNIEVLLYLAREETGTSV